MNRIVAVLRSIGEQRFTGIDVEGALCPAGALTVKGNIDWNDASYRDFVDEIGGVPTQLVGEGRFYRLPARRIEVTLT